MEKTASGKRVPIPGYCIGVEVGDRKDCHKVVDGCCTLYLDICAKMGRAGNVGCSFSPLESPISQKTKVRVGQQKQKRKK